MSANHRVMTVLGPVSAEDLGRTLIHEHLVLGYPGWEFDSVPKLDARTKVRLGDWLRQLRDEFGVQTFVDPAPIEMGRNTGLMAEISESTGINIIATTGFYTGSVGIPAYWRQRTVDEITEFMLRELEEGTNGTDIRAGAIKVSTRAGTEIIPNEERLLRIAGHVAAQAGVPVVTHTEDATLGPEQVDVMVSGGMDPAGILVGHCCQTSDIRYFDAIIKRGAFVGFDQVGWQFYKGHPPDHIRATCIAGLIATGFGLQVMISGDRIGHWLGRHNEPQATALERMSREGYAQLFVEFIPMLLSAGVSPQAIDIVLIDNPRRLFTRASSV